MLKNSSLSPTLVEHLTGLLSGIKRPNSRTGSFIQDMLDNKVTGVGHFEMGGEPLGFTATHPATKSSITTPPYPTQVDLAQQLRRGYSQARFGKAAGLKLKPLPKYGPPGWQPTPGQQLKLDLLKHVKDHMEHPDTKHIMSWHEKDQKVAMDKSAFSIPTPRLGAFTATARHQDDDTKKKMMMGAEGLGAFQGIGWGAHQLNIARKFRPSNLIAVTAGALKKPTLSDDTSAGHVTPADAVHEALQKHPAVQSGEFVADKAYRLSDMGRVQHFKDSGGLDSAFRSFVAKFDPRYQKPFELQNQKVHGQNHAAVTIDTGFGAGASRVPHKGGFLRGAQFIKNPKGHVGFIPDPLKGQPGLFHKMFLNAPDPVSKLNYVGYGEDNGYDASSFNRLGHYPVHPAIKDQVLDLAQSRLDNPLDRNSVFQELSQKLRQTGDHGSADLIDDAIQKGKKIITVSGSSRGDLVAYRAMMAHNTLVGNKMDHNHLVLALLADAKNNPNDMTEHLIKGLPVASVGNTNNLWKGEGQKKMFDLINASDYHMGSTGASAAAESTLSRTPTGFVTNYAKMREAQINLLKQKFNISPQVEKDLRNVDLDEWNSGTISSILNNYHNRGMGIDAVNDPEQLMHQLRKIQYKEKLKRPAGYAGRARDFLDKSRSAKHDFADKIIQHAREVNRNSIGLNKFHTRFGGGLLTGGGLLGADLLRRLYQERHVSQIKQSNDSSEQHEGILPRLHNPLLYGGLATAATLGSFLPATRPLGKIMARNLHHRMQVSPNLLKPVDRTAGRNLYKSTFGDSSYNANTVHDYIDSTSHMFHTPLAGLRKGIQEVNNGGRPSGPLSRYFLKYLDKPGAAHYLRFASGPRTAMEHWISELVNTDQLNLDQIKNSLRQSGVHPETAMKRKDVVDKMYPLQHYSHDGAVRTEQKHLGKLLNDVNRHNSSRDAFWKEYEQHIGAGATEMEAVKALGHSDNPQVKEMLQRMAWNKKEPFDKTYGPMSNTANLGTVGGLGIAGVGAMLPSHTDNQTQ